MKLVQRCSVVVTEDMPVDPEAHDLQVCLQVWPMSSSRYLFQPALVSVIHA